ncbi:fibronectin type III domain-containing protein [bacterium]|nr:fibronectin type III domain-containing protein [bacterium]
MKRNLCFFLFLSVIMFFSVSYDNAGIAAKSDAKDLTGTNFDWDVVFSVEDLDLDFMYTPAETSGASYHCTPSDPNPAVDSTDVEYENITISWDCTEGNKAGVTYNVYLGTDQRLLPRVSENKISQMSVTLDRLLPGTKYYWTVVAYYENEQTRNAERWTFTTKKGKLPPYIKLAGYGVTNITEGEGGTLSIFALCEDQDGTVEQVKVYFQGNDTGIRLSDNNKDTVWDFNFPGVSAGIPKGTEFVIELVAVDDEGNESDMWPYMTVHSDYPKIPIMNGSVIPWLDHKLDISEFDTPYNFTLTKNIAVKIVEKVFAPYPQNPLSVPAILVGGYWNTFLKATGTNDFALQNITAIVWKAVKNVSSVDVYENMNIDTPYADPQGNAVMLHDDGDSKYGDEKANDNWWTYMNVFQGDAGIVKLGIIATDMDNKKSDMWPKVVIH